jgi:hypothetical protein
VRPQRAAENVNIFWDPPPCLAGAVLAFSDREYHVFRAALFSIVLTLAMGQSAGLLCEVWCHDGPSAHCAHQDSTASPSVSADDNCRSAIIEAAAFVREDTRRTAAAPDQHAVIVSRFRLAPLPTDLRHRFELGQRRPLEERPLVLTLRI